jgi:two-component system, chemotaxis family, protein-glutamate methylesterase/glutaminase
MDNRVGEQKIRVLVVDDSVLMSRQISNILANAGGIEVVGRAKDGREALSMVDDLKPDVVTLDVEMPTMNGITALKHIMIKHATPAVMISALTTEGARATFDAFKFGAFDVVAKPSRREDVDLAVQKAEIVAKVKRAAGVSRDRLRYIRIANSFHSSRKTGLGSPDDKTHFFVLGSGTGGHYTLLRILPALPENFPGVVVSVIQMAARYLELFVSFLSVHSQIPVVAGLAGKTVEKGVCYLCSSDQCLSLGDNGAGQLVFRGTVSPQDPPAGSEGAVDTMFRAVAALAGSMTVGVVLSGVGRDGGAGLMEIKRHGGMTVVQEINNCTDPTMPLAALEKGTVERILPDYQMGPFFTRLANPVASSGRSISPGPKRPYPSADFR